MARGDLPFFMALKEHFAARGIACPLPLRARSGEVIIDVEGKPAALVQFLEGRSSVNITRAQMHSLGECVARMHLAAQSFPLTRGNALSLEGWKSLYAEMGGALNNIVPTLEDMVRDEITWLSSVWPQQLPRGVIHADIFPDNVFFTGDTVSGVIDFYFACTDAFAYDLAIVINAWCFDGDGIYDATRQQALIEGYEKHRTLSDREMHALPILLRGSALRFLLTRAYDLLNHDVNALVHPKDPMEYVRKLQYHQKQYKESTHE
jgi:homoserine kinase type II